MRVFISAVCTVAAFSPQDASKVRKPSGPTGAAGPQGPQGDRGSWTSRADGPAGADGCNRPARPGRNGGPNVLQQDACSITLASSYAAQAKRCLGDVSRRHDHHEQLLSDMQQHARPGTGAVYETVSPEDVDRRSAA